MAKYNALMDMVLKAGLAETITAQGFKRKRPRLFVREHDLGYEFIHFAAGSKYGGDAFCDVIGIFHSPFQKIYDELFPEGVDNRDYPYSGGALPCHAFSDIQWLCQLDMSQTPDGAFPYTYKKNKYYINMPKYTPFANRTRLWIGNPEQAASISSNISEIFIKEAVEWINSCRDPAYIASWIGRENIIGHIEYSFDENYAATFFHLAGEHERARILLCDCVNLATVSYESLEMSLRQSRFLGFGKGPSTERSRSIAEGRLQLRKEAAKMARRLADHFGYEIGPR